jgi:hypothetical protein
MNDENKPEEAEEPVSVSTWEEAPEELRDYFIAADLTTENLPPWAMSRAVKVLLVMLKMLEDDGDPDSVTALAYSAAVLSNHLGNEGWPVQKGDLTGVQTFEEALKDGARKYEKLVEGGVL